MFRTFVIGGLWVILGIVSGCSPPQAPVDETHIDASVEEPVPPTLSVDDARRAIVDQDRDTSVDLQEEAALLPDMFGEKEAKRVRMSGKMLTDEEAESLDEQLDGVELKLEMQTK